jgi:hypothetical protein
MKNLNIGMVILVCLVIFESCKTNLTPTLSKGEGGETEKIITLENIKNWS